MSLSEQQRNFIKLNGDPVFTSFTQAASHSVITKTAALTTLFNIAATHADSPQKLLAVIGAGAASYAAVMGVRHLSDWFDHFSTFGRNHAGLCINKDPQPSTPPTSPTHLRAAHALRFRGVLFGVMSALTAAQGLGVALATMAYVKDVPTGMAAGLAGSTVSIASLGAHFASATNRFHNVVKQKWVITDLPRKVEEIKRVESTRAIPQPV